MLVMPVALPMMLKAVKATVATTPHTTAPAQLMPPQPSAAMPPITTAAGTATLTSKPIGATSMECRSLRPGVPVTIVAISNLLRVADVIPGGGCRCASSSDPRVPSLRGAAPVARVAAQATDGTGRDGTTPMRNPVGARSIRATVLMRTMSARDVTALPRLPRARAGP